MGTYPAIVVPTVIAQNASWSHGSRYPVNESARVSTNSPMPITQLNCRGRRYAPE
jgi:hypothetical protein